MRLERDETRTLLILAVLAGVFVLGLWLPLRLGAARVNERIDAANASLGANKDAVGDLGRLADEVTTLQQIVDSTKKYVPQTHEEADLLQRLSGAMTRQRLHVDEMLGQSRDIGEDYGVISVSLRFRGSFASVYGFIQELETMRRLVRIVDMRLVGNPRHPGEPLLVRMHVSSFFSPVQGGLKP